MNSIQAVTVSVSQDVSMWRRLSIFFGHYDFRVYLTPRAYLDVGAGSLSLAQHITNVLEQHSGCLGSIGRYCENAPCEIQSAGDHLNDRPVNLSFAGGFSLMTVVGHGAGYKGISDAKPIRIGNAVVISSGAKILPGVTLGDGSVVGAGAIVTRDVEPFTIVAGIPAKKLRARLSPEVEAKVRASTWWDWLPAELLAVAGQIQESVLEGPREKRPERPRFVLDLVKAGDPKLVGFARDEEIAPFSDAPQNVRDYVTHALGASPKHWLADCWRT